MTKFNTVLATIFTLVLMPSLLMSQQIEIKNGQNFQLSSLETLNTVLSASDEGVSFITNAGLFANKFRVVNIDSELNFESKIDFDLPKIGKKKVKFVGCYNIGGVDYFMTRFYDKKEKSHYLYASILNTSNGNFEKAIEVIKVKDAKFNRLNPFSFVISPDSSKIAVIAKYPVKNKENVRYGAKVLNDQLGEVWSNDIEFSEPDKEFSLSDIEVDSEGNLHMIARMRMTRKEKKASDSSSRYYMSVYSYFYADQDLNEYLVSFKDDIIRSMDMDINDDGDLVGYGFYSEKKFSLSDSYKGFFFLKINTETKSIVNSVQTEFDKKLIEELANARKAKKGKFPPYVIRESIALSNGGYAVVAEHYVYRRTESDNKTTETWLYGNAVVMYLDSEGSMQSASVLKKKQFCKAVNGNANILQKLGFSITPGVNELPYYGLGISESEDNIYILFNDSPKNAERLKEGKKPQSVRQRTSVTKLLTCTPDGDSTESVLFKSKDAKEGVKMPLMPRSIINYDENHSLVIGRKGKNMRVTKITKSK